MRFYTRVHQYYCGIDLHARSMYVCIISHDGEILVHRNMKATPEDFLQTIAPYRQGLVVGVECMFCWYWLADLCHQEKIPFVLGHALYMKAIHGGKAKNDRIDAEKIAILLRGGNFPVAYVYPRQMRATRDLLRRRMYLVRRRGELLTHIQNTNSQYNLEPFGKKIAYRTNREGVAESFPDPSVRKSIEADLGLLDYYDELLRKLELFLVRNAKVHDPHAFHRLRTIPGTGKILSLVMLYEIHDIRRFPRVQNFISYARLVKCARESAGKRVGSSGKKIGNVHLKWAFSEAVVTFIRHCPEAKKKLDRLTRRYGEGKALSILAAKLGRTVYFMLLRKEAFELKRFMAA